MKFRISLLALMVPLITIFACSPVEYTLKTPSVDRYPIIESQRIEPYVAPEYSTPIISYNNVHSPIPDEGKACLSGILYQKSHSAVLTNFFLYLTPAKGDNNDQPPTILAGPLADKGDIGGKTNEKGEFIFTNLVPGNYFLVVNLGYDYEIAIKSIDDPTPLLIQISPNQQLSLGTVIIP